MNNNNNNNNNNKRWNVIKPKKFLKYDYKNLVSGTQGIGNVKT